MGRKAEVALSRWPHNRHTLSPSPRSHLQDVLHHLRPRLKRYASYEEALAAVTDIINKEAAVGLGGGMLGAIDAGEGVRGSL